MAGLDRQSCEDFFQRGQLCQRLIAEEGEGEVQIDRAELASLLTIVRTRRRCLETRMKVVCMERLMFMVQAA